MIGWVKKIVAWLFPPPMEAKARPKATMSMRVYRAATGKWEDVK